jgi:hypothetical protein
MVTAELNADEILRPIMLAHAAVENKASQYTKYIPLIPRIELAMMIKRKACIALIKNNMAIFEMR